MLQAVLKLHLATAETPCDAAPPVKPLPVTRTCRTPLIDALITALITARTRAALSLALACLFTLLAPGVQAESAAATQAGYRVGPGDELNFQIGRAHV